MHTAAQQLHGAAVASACRPLDSAVSLGVGPAVRAPATNTAPALPRGALGPVSSVAPRRAAQPSPAQRPAQPSIPRHADTQQSCEHLAASMSCATRERRATRGVGPVEVGDGHAAAAPPPPRGRMWPPAPGACARARRARWQRMQSARAAARGAAGCCRGARPGGPPRRGSLATRRTHGAAGRASSMPGAPGRAAPAAGPLRASGCREGRSGGGSLCRQHKGRRVWMPDLYTCHRSVVRSPSALTHDSWF
jgi:hypothetical protein